MDLDGFDGEAQLQVSSPLPPAPTSSDALKYIDEEWYFETNRRGRWMDLIGDYAGSEPFVIDGDALFQQVLNDSLLALGRHDEPSFQILHAFWSLERVLKEFQSRDANIDVVFWQYNRHPTCRTGSSDIVVSSRMLARAMLFRHLNALDITIHCFDSLSDPRWIDYMSNTKPMFVMTADGGVVRYDDPDFAVDADRILLQRVFIYDLLSQGCSVSLLPGAEYRDSKIMSFIYEHRHDPDARSHLRPELWAASDAALGSLGASESLVRRGVLIVSLMTLTPQHLQPSPDQDAWIPEFIRAMLSDRYVAHAARHEMLWIFTAHILILPALSLPERARQLDKLHPDLLNILLTSFLPSVFVSLEYVLPRIGKPDLDGRVYIALFAFLLRQPEVSPAEVLGAEAHVRMQAIWSSCGLPHVDFASISRSFPNPPVGAENPAPARPRGLLPFSHPCFDDELAPVHVDLTEDSSTSLVPRMHFNTAFNDVYHWHNDRRSILPPHLGGDDPPPMDERQRFKKLRSDQRFMASLERQAQTLTGAFGIPLEQQVILSTRSTGRSSSKTDSKPRVITDHATKSSKKAKAERLTSADKIRQANAAKKQSKEDDSNQTWWQDQLKIFSQESVSGQLVLVDNLLRNKRTRDGWLAVEIRLYRLHLQFVQWVGRPDQAEPVVRDETITRILCTVKDTYRQPHLFPAAVSLLDSALTAVGLSTVVTDLKASVTVVDSDRTLSFKFVKLLKSKTGSPVHKFMPINEELFTWQLRLFGEYMDRSMDSEADPRVPFWPDAWQRKVLDCLDANESVLVVAPTSAGKTFISYYAMEQVLKTSDDGILVYVAPTKALVNQIAAEVYARFKKELTGKSCWAIHTRDYRVHDPQNCQILVTVPEMLATMLLSPPLARTWTPRIRRIILDEIHTIGQQEGGAVWEQILLLSPCPIIGLSATIGHPERFNSWLQSVQEAHGFKHSFIYHPHRYSHLRKFMYALHVKPPSPFTGLPAHSDTQRIKLLHPVALLSFGTRELPPDFSLEASDCLSLFATLQHFRAEIPFDTDELHPAKFFASSSVKLLRQKDVLEYEAALKVVLARLLESAECGPVLARITSHLTDPSLRQLDAQFIPPMPSFRSNLIYFLADLRSKGDLPAMLFHFDRKACEMMGQTLLDDLEKAESKWRSKSSDWKRKIERWEVWKSQAKVRERQKEKDTRRKKDGDEEQGGTTSATWESSFDPSDPSPEFSFAGISTAYSKDEIEYELASLARWTSVPEWACKALQRGIGIHHSGMNKRYRTLVESLYRVGFLKVMIATGTLALGINAPTKTSAFCGDSLYLTALMFRQCAGRAGRRGFDLLGKVVFYGLSMSRCQRLVLSRLPSLGGNWPLTTTMVLRLFNLLQGSDSAPIAVNAIRSILQLPHISFTSDFGKQQILHFMRFAIDYLRRAGLLDEGGNPINLFGIASHLYYTEPGNLALVTLFRHGILHKVCGQKDSIKAQRDFISLMSHLFGRRYVPKSYATDENLRQLIKKSPSMVVLPPLSRDAEAVLMQHDGDILRVFTEYALAYTTQRSDDLGPDTVLPLSGRSHDALTSSETSFHTHLRRTATNVRVRSLFAANSGLGDTFRTVDELSTTARQGLYLNPYAIPSMSGFTSSATNKDSTALNAYLLDFFIHGQPAALRKANGIRDNDMWYLLEDFTLTLKAVRANISRLLKTASDSHAKRGLDGDLEGLDEDDVDSGYGTYASGDVDDETQKGADLQSLQRPPAVSDEDWRVFEVIYAATQEFETKFKAMWA